VQLREQDTGIEIKTELPVYLNYDIFSTPFFCSITGKFKICVGVTQNPNVITFFIYLATSNNDENLKILIYEPDYTFPGELSQFFSLLPSVVCKAG
jgi:hypothetical protein